MRPVEALQGFGQSVWLDYIRRQFVASGELARMVQEDGLRGVTSNPSIFEKAIEGSTDYNEALARAEQEDDRDAIKLFELCAIRDIQDAADVLRPVFDETLGVDGYVSIEVSPYLAHDTERTIAEARRLYERVGRDNLMVKVPGTPQGIPAIRQLIAEGRDVNATLLFSLDAYAQVIEAYLSGLEAFATAGGDLSTVASVASFFVSRVDTAADAALNQKIKDGSDADEALRLRGLLGKTAIANAKLAYRLFKERFSGPRWDVLAASGARPQRPLWASTSTKNPAYRDVMYVEELIGPHTVNTMPLATFQAFQDHGKPRASVEDDVDGARATLEALERAGVSLAAITDRLVTDGVRLFADDFDKLLAAVERKRAAALGCLLDRTTWSLPEPLAEEVETTLDQWRESGTVRRLWARDATLWTGRDESRWLDWLGITEEQREHMKRFTRIAEDARDGGFTHVVLLGMGGSSLCPEVLGSTFGPQEGYPTLHVLDSTDPGQVAAVEERLDLARTLFVVSSKSGTTLEPAVLKDYFLSRVRTLTDAPAAPQQFVAITDMGSALHRGAEVEVFRHVFLGVPGIGGRFSALSDFGMVPAALMGLDVPRFLENAETMVQSCAWCVPPKENPGAAVGAVLGTLARNGRDKVTIVTSPGIADLGAWLEQLLAESTGKAGKGLVPVDGEALGSPEVYGADRLFVYLRWDASPDAAQDEAIGALEHAGQPVLRISISELYDLGQEFFRWEMATAVAGALLGVSPFDQPDVEASKVETRSLMEEYERSGALPHETPILEQDGIRVYAGEANTRALGAAARPDSDLVSLLAGHLGRVNPGDFVALLAYLDRNAANTERLQAIRHAIRDATRAATCLGFGPRFLHSTGQLYKGGPNTGVFLQITCDDTRDLPVPGRRYTLGAVKAAQALGDLRVLNERGRRAIRIHVGAGVAAGLDRLADAVRAALGRHAPVAAGRA